MTQMTKPSVCVCVHAHTGACMCVTIIKERLRICEKTRDSCEGMDGAEKKGEDNVIIFITIIFEYLKIILLMQMCLFCVIVYLDNS